MNQYKKIKFSLIELLVVMAITAVMLGIIIPTFHKVTKGVNVEMGARQFGAQLKAVREYAITHRKRVALIIPSTEAIPSNYLYRAYRPSIVVGSSTNFDEWVFGERWEFMPDGTSILAITTNKPPDDGPYALPDPLYDAASSVGVVKFNDIVPGISDTTAKGIVFTPTGRCAGGRTYVCVGDPTMNPVKNYVTITIDQFTGRISYGNE